MLFRSAKCLVLLVKKLLTQQTKKGTREMSVIRAEPAFRWALKDAYQDPFYVNIDNLGKVVKPSVKVLQQAWIDILTGEVEWKDLETVDLRKAQE